MPDDLFYASAICSNCGNVIRVEDAEKPLLVSCPRCQKNMLATPLDPIDRDEKTHFAQILVEATAQLGGYAMVFILWPVPENPTSAAITVSKTARVPAALWEKVISGYLRDLIEHGQ
jgi:hypothetical protein